MITSKPTILVATIFLSKHSVATQSNYCLALLSLRFVNRHQSVSRKLEVLGKPFKSLFRFDDLGFKHVVIQVVRRFGAVIGMES